MEQKGLQSWAEDSKGGMRNIFGPQQQMDSRESKWWWIIKVVEKQWGIYWF